MIWVYIASDILSTGALVASIWAYRISKASLRRIQAIKARQDATYEPTTDANA